MSQDIPNGLPGDPYSVGLKGQLVLSGHRVGVKIGAHEVLYLDVLLRSFADKNVTILVEGEKP